MSSDAEQPRIILPDGGPDSQELDHERRKGIVNCNFILLKNFSTIMESSIDKYPLL